MNALTELADREPSKDELRWLRAPDTRGFFFLCRNFLRAQELISPHQVDTIVDHFPEGPSSFVATMARLHLLLLMTLQKRPGAWRTAGAEVTQKMAEEWSAPTVGLGFASLQRQLTDLASELSQEATLDNLQPRGKVICSALPLPASSLTVPILLYSVAQEVGLRANLTIEAMTGGSGIFYPIPALMFVHMDGRWQKAITQAELHFENLKVIPQGYDFRYRITLPSEVNWGTSLEGDSWHGALEFALALLLHRICPGRTREIFPEMADLDPPGSGVNCIAVTAGTSESVGIWSAVGNLGEKILAADAKKIHPRVPILVMPIAQPFDSSLYVRPRPNVEIFREPGEGPEKLHIIRAGPGSYQDSLRETLRLLLLHQQRKPRPARPESLDLCIARPGFRKCIESFLKEKPGGILLISGEKGVGKTTAMHWLIEEWEKENRKFIYCFIGLSEGGTQKHIAKSLVNQLLWMFSFEDSTTEQNDPNRLLQLIKAIFDHGAVTRAEPVVILIDGPENLQDNTLGALVPRLIRDLPEGVNCVITLPSTDTPAVQRTSGLWECSFEKLVDQPKEGRELVERRNRKNSLGLTPELIRGIFKDEPAPSMDMLDHNLKRLEAKKENAQ